MSLVETPGGRDQPKMFLGIFLLLLNNAIAFRTNTPLVCQSLHSEAESVNSGSTIRARLCSCGEFLWPRHFPFPPFFLNV